MRNERSSGGVPRDIDVGPGAADPEEIRARFPLFLAAPDRAYLDSAASTQPVDVVIDRISRYYSEEHANIHRGAYRASADATVAYEASRAVAASFVGARSPDQIVFTRGATESVNLVAHALGHHFGPGDSILVTLLEHHSNIVPWQILAERTGARVEFADVRPDATVDPDDFVRRLDGCRPKLVAMTLMSNAFGTVTPASEMAAAAKERGAVVLMDAAQAAAHFPLDVGRLGCDFLVFSGHKVYGPTGIGVLYVGPGMYPRMRPFQGGGDMISVVTTSGSEWAEPPRKFEAGTPPIAAALGLAEALTFVSSLDREAVARHEKRVFDRLVRVLSAEPSVTLHGPISGGPISTGPGSTGPGSGGPGTPDRSQCAVVSFSVAGVHPHDLGSIADSFDVQIRGGHHCAMPALRRLDLHSTARASVGMYSREADADLLGEAVRHAVKLFS